MVCPRGKGSHTDHTDTNMPCVVAQFYTGQSSAPPKRVAELAPITNGFTSSYPRNDHVDVELQATYHSSNATLRTDIRGHAFEGHDGARTGLFGYASLLSVHDVHYNAALEHTREHAWG